MLKRLTARAPSRETALGPVAVAKKLMNCTCEIEFGKNWKEAKQEERENRSVSFLYLLPLNFIIFFYISSFLGSS